jgi:hypothetical protein
MTKLSIMISHMSVMIRIQIINPVIYLKISTSAWAMQWMPIKNSASVCLLITLS